MKNVCKSGNVVILQPVKDVYNIFEIPESLVSAAPDMRKALDIADIFMDAIEKKSPSLYNSASVIMLANTIKSAIAKAKGE